MTDQDDIGNCKSSGTDIKIAVSPHFCNYLNKNEFRSIYKFSSTDSQNIIAYLDPNDTNKNVIFNNGGSIRLTENNVTKFDFPNKLTNKGVVSNLTDKIKLSNNNKEFFLSPEGYWLLFVDPNNKKVEILYNHFHREEFKKYYNKQRYPSLSLFKDYCEKISNKDPSCYCMLNEEKVKNDICMFDLFKGDSVQKNKVKSIDNKGYTNMERYCACLNSNCISNMDSFKDSSFVNLVVGDKCKNNTISFNVCNSEVKAGNNLTGNTNVIQQCGVETSKSNDPSSTTETKSDITPSSGSLDNKTDDNKTDNNKTNPFIQEDGNPNYILIGGIAVGVIILIIIIMLISQ